MTLTNPSLVLTFVGSGTIPVTTVSNSEIVRQSIEIDWQMMSNLKSTSDKAKISITKESVAVSRIMSFDGDISAVLKDGDTVLFTGFLSNKYKWSVTNHGEQVLSLTIEDNTRLLETIYSDKDQLINKEFYIPARVGHPVASGVLVDIATLCGISLDASVPEIDVDIIKTVSADTECVDIIDQVCFELGYCYKFKADGKLYLWQIAKGDEPVSATLTKDSLYAVQENAVIVNKSLKQYNRAIVKYTDIGTRSNTLIYQDISGQDDTHAFCHIEVRPGFAYPSGLAIAGHTDDQLRAVCEATDLSEGKTIIGIGDTITPEFICTASGITADIRKYSANSVSVLVKNTLNVPIYIEKLQAKASITYEEGESKVYAGSVTDKKYYETSLEYVHDNDTASKLGNLIYQFYKHSNLAYTFYSKTQLALGDIIMLQENQYSGVNAKLMINAIVDSSATGVYQYVGYSFTPFNLQEGTSTNSKGFSPTVIPGPRGADGQSVTVQYALSDSPDVPPILLYQILGSASDEAFGSSADDEFGTIDSTESQWQPSVPYPVPSGMYIWMRTSTNGSTWAYSRVTGEKGADGGEQGYELIVNASNFYINRRSTASREITVYTTVTGYTNVTSNISVTNGAYSAQNNTITYNLDNNFTEIRIDAVLTDNTTGEVLETKTATLNPVDITEAPMFLGCIAGANAPPTATPNNENVIGGDHFCVSTTSGDYTMGSCWRYTDSGWTQLNSTSGTPTELLNCLTGFQTAGVNLSAISDSSAIAWFNAIVSNKVIADEILGNIATFNGLTINNTATFNGTLAGEVLKTMPAVTTSKTYNSQSSLSGSSVFYWRDVQTVYASKYNSSYYGTLRTASGTFYGKTASKVVYHTSSSLSSTVENIASGYFPEGYSPEITIASPICTTKYKITIVLPSGIPTNVIYEVYNGSTLESSASIVSGMAGGTVTVTTVEIPCGKTLKLAATLGATSISYNVKLHHSQNYGVGTNVITADGWKYNVNGSLPTNTNSQALTGTGTTRPSLTVDGTAWTTDTTNCPAVIGFPGQNGEYTADTAGSSSNITGHAYFRYRGESTVSYTIVSASWGASNITFKSDTGVTTTFNASTSNLEYWDINFTIATSTQGVMSKGLLPFDTTTDYYIGATDQKWADGHFTNFHATNIYQSGSSGAVNAYKVNSTSVETNYLRGKDGGSSYIDVARIDCLYLNDILGGDFKYFRPDWHMDVDAYDDSYTITSSSYTITGESLALGEMRITGFTFDNTASKIKVQMTKSTATYKYLLVLTSNYCNNTGGSLAVTGEIAGGSSNAVTHSFYSSSGGGGGFIVYWRTA